MADGIRFSLDIGYELSGPDTTNWKQTTRESADGCLFDFEVFVREKGEDRKDLAGSAVCQNGKKVLRLTFPVRSEAVFRKCRFSRAADNPFVKGRPFRQKNVSAYVYDGTRPEALYSVNAAVSAPEQMLSEKIGGDADLVAGKKRGVSIRLFSKNFPPETCRTACRRMKCPFIIMKTASAIKSYRISERTGCYPH